MIVFVLIVSFPFHIPFTVEFFLSVKISLDEKWKGESNANKSCGPGRYCSIHRPSGTRDPPGSGKPKRTWKGKTGGKS